MIIKFRKQYLTKAMLNESAGNVNNVNIKKLKGLSRRTRKISDSL